MEFPELDAVESELSPKELTAQLNLGYSRFRKLFKLYTGFSPGQYHQELKIQRTKELLQNSNGPVKQIAYSLGFGSNHYFCRYFKRKTGLMPGEYRRRARYGVIKD